jgi:AraC family transcriptional regulator
MEITVVELPDRRAAGVLHVGPFHEIGAAFERLGAWIAAHPGAAAGPPLGLYLSNPEATAPGDLHSYAAVPVSGDVEVRDSGVEEISIPGGRYATFTHHGTYAALPQAWASFTERMRASGLAPDPTRPGFEEYANDPGQVGEDDLITVLFGAVS